MHMAPAGIGILAGVGVVLVARMISSFRASTAQRARMSSAFVADPNNRTSVIVRGWSYDELITIKSYFLTAYDLPKSTVVITARSRNTLAITFPNDIEPEILFYLVNYIQYPKGFDLTHRSIGVVAHVVLGSAFGVPDEAMRGKNAIVYVPANDREYDLVYAKVAAGRSYRIPFTDLAWRPVDDPRIPAAIAVL